MRSVVQNNASESINLSLTLVSTGTRGRCDQEIREAVGGCEQWGPRRRAHMIAGFIMLEEGEGAFNLLQHGEAKPWPCIGSGQKCFSWKAELNHLTGFS